VSAGTTSDWLGAGDGDDVDRDRVHTEGTEEGLGLGVDVERGLSLVQSGDLWHVGVLPLTLLLLQTEGDTADGTLLDTLHQVGGETGDLVPEPLGRDHSDLIDQPLVGVEVEGETRVVSLDEDAGGPLDGFRADSTLEKRGEGVSVRVWRGEREWCACGLGGRGLSVVRSADGL